MPSATNPSLSIAAAGGPTILTRPFPSLPTPAAEPERHRTDAACRIRTAPPQPTAESLRATDERLALAASAANVGLWDWDLVTNEVFYSAIWKRQLGYLDHELENSYEEWSSRVHPDDLPGAVARLNASVADPTRPYHTEFRLRHRDGSYRLIQSEGAFSFDKHGKPIRMLGSHIDCTEKRRLEDELLQAQKMEAVGRLAGGVAHDFNNLLTVINGYSEVVLNQLAVDSPLREPLLEIHRAGNRAADLTKQLLAFSRRQVLTQKVLDLNAVVQDIERMLRRLIGEDVLLTLDLCPRLGLVKADPGQVEQVLMNLAVNARDAMPKGGRLTIATERVTLDERYCRPYSDLVPGDYSLVAVSDTGSGMDEATQARIFEPFFTTKEIGRGTGLGLATVHGIVKQSRGHIVVESEVGRGTTFKVYLPEVCEPNEEATGAARPRQMPLGAETILLVEDENSLRTLGKQILLTCGYRVLEANDGEDALRLAQQHAGSIDLLVTDIVMPNLGGRKLAERFALLKPQCKVLFISGYTDDAILRQGILGADQAFLHKPFTPAALAHKVRSVLNGKQA